MELMQSKTQVSGPAVADGTLAAAGLVTSGAFEG